MDNDQATAREGWEDANHNLFSILYFTISGPAFFVVLKFKGKTKEDKVGHGQDAGAALREKSDGCLREALRAAHREMEMVKIWSDEDTYDLLYKKDRCRDRLDSVTPEEGLSNRRYEDITLQCLLSELDRTSQIHFERADCNLADVRRMISKIYTDNLASSHSDSPRGIAGRGVTMQATGWDLSKMSCHYCILFGRYKNDCASFKAAHYQNRRRRQRHHKQQGGHRPHQPKPGVQQQQRGGGEIWCSYHKATTHSDANCRTRPAYRPNGNTHFAQVHPPSVPEICSSWDLPVRDVSDEKACILFLAIEVHPAATPAKAQVEEEKRARPFGAVRTAAMERCKTRPWSFTARAEPQPATKPIKGQVEEKKGARPFGPVSTAATDERRTHPWPFTLRAEQAISFEGSVTEEKSNLCYTFGVANDEEPVENTLMASSSVAVTSEDSVNSYLATLMASAEYLPGEVREPLSGGASTPLSAGASTSSGGRASPVTV